MFQFLHSFVTYFLFSSPIDDLTGKFDCYGRSELAKQEERRQKKFWEEAMKADINARIERAKMSNKIPQMTIDIVSINTWLELGEK